MMDRDCIVEISVCRRIAAGHVIETQQLCGALVARLLTDLALRVCLSALHLHCITLHVHHCICIALSSVRIVFPYSYHSMVTFEREV